MIIFKVRIQILTFKLRLIPHEIALSKLSIILIKNLSGYVSSQLFKVLLEPFGVSTLGLTFRSQSVFYLVTIPLVKYHFIIMLLIIRSSLTFDQQSFRCLRAVGSKKQYLLCGFKPRLKEFSVLWQRLLVKISILHLS
jgi:hypothetical protein